MSIKKSNKPRMSSFIRGEMPTVEELAEESRLCVMHVDKNGNVIHFMRRAADEPTSELDDKPAVTVNRIISGGQTGADRAALDWAIAHHVSHGGWCPKGRRAEDGSIPAHYQLQETPTAAYPERTIRNVREADATLILTLAKELTGGSLLTQEAAQQWGKPCLHLHPDTDWRDRLRAFMTSHRISILNVAGPRASSVPGIDRFVHEVLDETTKP